VEETGEETGGRRMGSHRGKREEKGGHLIILLYEKSVMSWGHIFRFLETPVE
jgi:hypothetical protein